MDIAALKEMARYQAWADQKHWEAIRSNPILAGDPEIADRLKHMLTASLALQYMARGQPTETARRRAAETVDLESGMIEAHAGLASTIEAIDPEAKVDFPRGPQGPFQAPAAAVLWQALLHSQHHRGQNALRMRALGLTPPMTDFIIWVGLGKP